MAADRLLDLGDPNIDWCGLARSLGVAATRCETAEDFDAAFERAMRELGSKLIEAVI